MIPSDLAARLRMLTEASFFDSEPPVSGTARVREIQARLPKLLPGERFTATLTRPLPDGTFQAIVAGKSYTLALNTSAKAGDTLELVVVRNSAKALVAQHAATPSGLAGEFDAAGPGAKPNLSATGRLIGYLLTGQPPSRPASLAGGVPLLDAAPTPADAATLAPALRQALARSGLFYESHQLRWLAGKLDVASLRLEPQGQQQIPAAPSGATSGTPASASSTPAWGTPAWGTPVSGAATPGAEPGLSRTLANTVAEPASSAPGTAAGSAAVDNLSRPLAVPERLMPIVQQQLDALATQHYVWQGQAWPGQGIEWEIDDPGGGEQSPDDESASHWTTRLRLTLPRLGAVEAQLVLSPKGVALRLVADDASSATQLRSAHERLDGALAAANVPLIGFTVAQGHDDT